MNRIASHKNPYGGKFSLGDVPMPMAQGDKAAYEKALADLQLTMLRLQQAYYHQNRRAVIVFEGWDASGKGGAIRRLADRLDPRGVRVHPIGAPTPEEQGKHYLFRFWQRLPAKGTIGVFDRSWYGRLLVEAVEGFASATEVQRAYREIRQFEKMLHDDGCRVIKFFLHITKDEQARRFAERLSNPYKHWKLTQEDLRNRERWGDYERYISRMVKRTHTAGAPWHVIGGDHKWYARLQVLRLTLAHLGEDVDTTFPAHDEETIRAAREQLGL